VEPRDVAQAAIDAYHDHDLDPCMSYYASDVVVTGYLRARSRVPRDAAS
jgi:hypothetical protein